MYFWGSLAFLQITFLPGFILCYILGVRRLIPLIVYAFALSHLVNYFLVWLLCSLQLYTRGVLIFSIVIEFGLIIFLLRSLWQSKLENYIVRELRDWQNFLKKYRDQWFVMFFLLLALLCFIFPLGELYKAKNTIFTAWDAVVSWNAWALSWAQGIVPTGTGQYPQLLPANWSISYVLMQNQEVQFFNKASIPLFSCYTLLILLDDGIRKQRVRSIFAIVFATFLISHILRVFAISGLADLPVAFFSFLSIIKLLQIYEANPKSISYKKLNLGLVMAALLCASAMNTKQAALFTVLLFIVFVFLIIKKYYYSFDIKAFDGKSIHKKAIGSFTWALLFLFLIGLPWHIKKEMDIRQNKDSSNVEYVTQGIHQVTYQGTSVRQSYWERNKKAFAMLDGHLGPAAKYLVSLFLLAAIFYMPTLWILLLHVLPFLFIWTTFFSYDERNLALALPPLALLGGQGWEIIRHNLSKYTSIFFANRPFRVAYILFCILILILYINSVVKSKSLQAKQLEKQRLACDPDINYELYSYFAQPSSKKGVILTNYKPLVAIPEIEAVYQNYLDERQKAYKYYIRFYNITYVLVYLNDSMKQRVLSWGCKPVLESRYYTLCRVRG